MARRLRVLLWEYSGATHRDLVVQCQLDVGLVDPDELLDERADQVVAVARYMRQPLPVLMEMPLDEFRDTVRRLSELIRRENDSGVAGSADER